MNQKEPMAYIAQKKCGCIILAVVDTPDHRQETAKEVASAIKEGYTVRRATCAFVRGHFKCAEHRRKETAQLTLDRMVEPRPLDHIEKGSK